MSQTPDRPPAIHGVRSKMAQNRTAFQKLLPSALSQPPSTGSNPNHSTVAQTAQMPSVDYLPTARSKCNLIYQDRSNPSDCCHRLPGRSFHYLLSPNPNATLDDEEVSGFSSSWTKKRPEHSQLNEVRHRRLNKAVGRISRAERPNHLVPNVSRGSVDPETSYRDTPRPLRPRVILPAPSRKVCDSNVQGQRSGGQGDFEIEGEAQVGVSGGV
ncbi:hypothetical protein AAF712_009724 [Marasmius tenuissimus]|uniref:Uncharacterized protein n=1 Tax=Marasmius tenuissimus TaxID=585030 RepID=A0ABR2ZQ30_9AGAR